MSFAGSASPSRVGQRVRKKSKRYEDFVGGGPSHEFAPDSPHSPALSSPSVASMSPSSRKPSTSTAPIAKSSPLIGGGGMRASGFSAWSKTYSKQLLAKMPQATALELKHKLTDTWNTLPERERAQWKALAAKEAKEAQQRLNEAKNKAKPPASKSKLASSARKSALDESRSKRRTDKRRNARASPVRDDRKTPDIRGKGETAKDAAAHLMLLGESMKYIGERLTDHVGPLAVSGAVSVLLDALLSATGPLLCLTKEIPVMKGAIPQRTLENILDDTHYFMPGL